MISDIKPYPSAEIFNNKHRRRSVGLIGIMSKTVSLNGIIRVLQSTTVHGITSKTVFLIGTIRGSQTITAPGIIARAVCLIGITPVLQNITALGITSKRACLTGIIRDTPIITVRVTMSETEFLRNTHCI